MNHEAGLYFLTVSLPLLFLQVGFGDRDIICQNHCSSVIYLEEPQTQARLQSSLNIPRLGEEEGRVLVPGAPTYTKVCSSPLYKKA